MLELDKAIENSESGVASNILTNCQSPGTQTTWHWTLSTLMACKEYVYYPKQGAYKSKANPVGKPGMGVWKPIVQSYSNVASITLLKQPPVLDGATETRI